MYNKDLKIAEEKIEKMKFEIEVLQTQISNLYQLVSTMVKRGD